LGQGLLDHAQQWADYRNASAIKLSKVTIRFISDPAAQAAGLRCDQRAACISIPTLASKRDPSVAFRTDGKSPVRSNSPTIEDSHRLGETKWNVPC
jgi:hypothetical protein